MIYFYRAKKKKVAFTLTLGILYTPTPMTLFFFFFSNIFTKQNRKRNQALEVQNLQTFHNQSAILAFFLFH